MNMNFMTNQERVQIMSQIIQNIANAGYDIHSYFACARQVNDKYSGKVISTNQAYKVMDELFGFHIVVDHDKAADIALRYMITESVKRHVGGFNVTEDDVREIVKVKVPAFFERFQWLDPNFKAEIRDIPTADVSDSLPRLL